MVVKSVRFKKAKNSELKFEYERNLELNFV